MIATGRVRVQPAHLSTATGLDRLALSPLSARKIDTRDGAIHLLAPPTLATIARLVPTT